MSYGSRGTGPLPDERRRRPDARNAEGPDTSNIRHAADVLRDLLANLVPAVTVVPSMVATVGLLQNRFHYAYTSPAES